MFGRRRKQEEADAEAAREAERRALFAQLASRPDDICPFLGLATNRVGYENGANPEHRCYAFGDPAALSDDQQTKVCLDRGYGTCPRYLRGVLVIPTDELEALRRPAPARAEAPPPPPPQERRPRPVLLWLIGIVLLVGVAGAGAFALLGGLAPVASTSPTPTASPTGVPISPTPSIEASPSLASPTVAPTPEPTPSAGDRFIGYEVEVAQGDYQLFSVNDSGTVTSALDAAFDAPSRGEVQRIVAPNGLLHWRTVGGGYDGLSYIRDRSGPYVIREVYVGADGSLRYIRLPPGDS